MALPLLLELVKKSADYLATHGIANARRESEWIFAESLGLTRMDLYTRFDMPLDEVDVARLRALITRRGKREPLAYVLGNLEFHGLRLSVGPGVLVPRPETEELVDHLLKELPVAPARVLDIGTGSGAIALAIKSARPDCTVEAGERSEAALAIARANAQTLGCDVRFHLGDLAFALSGPYDAIAANLPYVGESERGACDPELAFEPAEALFAGDAGLDQIARLVPDLARLLAPAGVAWLEHGWQQGAGVRALCASAGLACTTIADGAAKERFARVARCAREAPGDPLAQPVTP
ncbi:MAG: peptide chain release factor N(5)-glutamine methyltransferase [Planctomycetes bacterium]|nr:peptide chain release factor N(5)-glutamine methyltransferase [Planctomycetota bacterium]